MVKWSCKSAHSTIQSFFTTWVIRDAFICETIYIHTKLTHRQQSWTHIWRNMETTNHNMSSDGLSPGTTVWLTAPCLRGALWEHWVHTTDHSKLLILTPSLFVSQCGASHNSMTLSIPLLDIYYTPFPPRQFQGRFGTRTWSGTNQQCFHIQRTGLQPEKQVQEWHHLVADLEERTAYVRGWGRGHHWPTRPTQKIVVTQWDRISLPCSVCR